MTAMQFDQNMLMDSLIACTVEFVNVVNVCLDHLTQGRKPYSKPFSIIFI